MEGAVGERFVFGEQVFNRLTIEIPRLLIVAKIGGEVAALFEILIAGGAFLAVPALFVGDRDGCQD